MIKLYLLLFLAAISMNIYSQDDSDADSVEINLIDNYITSDKPPELILSFFTNLPVKSQLIIEDKYKYTVSDTLTENHKDTIDISDFKVKSDQIHFVIQAEDSLHRKSTSEIFEIEVPQEVKMKEESNFLMLCLLGGTIFLVPSPVYLNLNGNSYFSLTKEIPLVFLRSGSFSYPAGYFSAEYSFVYNADKLGAGNFIRFGYKHIIQIPGIEYISPGVNGVTNFNGFNGISPELSVGWFRIFDTFTLYSRIRYNAKPGINHSEFSEISIGLYSGFFAIYF
jgi:hypothetical protein